MTSSVLRHAGSVCAPLAIALAVSSVFSSTSFAQSKSEPALGEVLVTATRSTQKAGDILADHVVITEEQILQSGQTSIIDLLQTQRSVEVTRNGGAGNSSNVFIRGSNEKQVVVLIDGVRTMSSTAGSATWSAIPLSQIERIEIVMGPMSSLYGADAVGGVIQVFTKKGSGAPRLSFSAGAGTYGERAYSVGVLGSTEGDHPIRYSFNTSQEKADGFSSRVGAAHDPDKDGYTKNSANGQVSWQLAKGHEIGVSALNSRNDGQYDGGTVPIPVFKPYVVSDIDIYSAYSRNQITSNWTSLFQVARAYNKNRDYVNSNLTAANSAQDQFFWQNDVQLGSDLLQVLMERRKESVTTSNQPRQNRERSNNSLAVAYQLKRDAHLVSASVRYDDSSVYGGNTSGSLGYGYKLNDTWRVNGSMGTSFRAPTYNDLYFSPNNGNPDVKPEKGRNSEIGLYYDGARTDFSAVYYHNKITDLIILKTPCVNPAYGSRCVTNVNEALLKGASLGAGHRVGNFRVYGNFDWQDPRDLTENKLLQRRARTFGSFGVSYRYEKFQSGFDVISSSYRYENAGNTTRLGGYTLLNVHGTYDFAKDWQLFARWNNVTDKKYQLADSYQTPGSNIFVGIRYGYN